MRDRAEHASGISDVGLSGLLCLLDNRPLACLDVEGRIERWTSAAQSLLGFTAAEALGQRLTALVRLHPGRPGHAAGLEFGTDDGCWVGDLELPGGSNGHPRLPVEIAAIAGTDPGDVRYVVTALGVAANPPAGSGMRAIANRLPVGLALYDREVRPVFVNSTAQRLIGILTELFDDPEERIRRFDLRHGSGRQVSADELPAVRALNGEVVEDFEYNFRRPGSADRSWGRISAVPVRDRTGAVTSALLVFVDLTNEHRLAAEVRLREERLKQVCGAVSAAIGVRDITGQVTYANNRSKRWLGIGVGDGLGPAVEVVDERGRPLSADDWPPGMALRTGVGQRSKVLGLRMPHGRTRWVRGDAVLVKLPGQAEPECVCSYVDITKEQKALQEARAAGKHLRRLTNRLVQLQETERLNLAHELHDELGQLLTALDLQLTAAGKAPASRAAEPLARAQDLARELSDRVRSMALNLRPPMLDRFGLEPALRWLVEQYEAQAGLRISLELSGEATARNSPCELAAFRIIQESLTNIVRHANATAATVSVSWTRTALRLTIEDDGIGMGIRAPMDHSGLGLLGIAERAASLGGTAEVVPRRGGGTRVAAVLPLHGRRPE